MTNAAYLVVGGASGLGKATAEALASRGANVVVSDLGTSVSGEGADSSVAREAAADIDAAVDGTSVVAHAGDAADAADAEEAVETTLESFGRLDGVANFAGILRDGMCWNLTEDDWDAVIDSHLRSNFTLLRAAVRHWRAVDDGSAGGDEDDGASDAHGRDRSYLAVSSRGALGNVGQLAYASANAGILGFVRSASTELHRQGVRVNALVPNGFTRMTASIPEEHRPYTREEKPPEAVAPAAVSLLTAADDVTGVTLTAAGDEIGVLSDPRQVRTGVREDGWTVDAIDETLESVADGYALTRTERFL
ncbi:SDR family NAD(P)-dependent oxidoreductase [Natrarchaeobaculum aegyptiacum]|uniref:Dehydrogenase n=1 Tax=Natrarchaeobaculum aegyptiacum TaxID=745377 RepID=A0A2Z2HTL0_9EURY|nr:SDR family NAD(P)-dependent oxidoreductase [Natrarchaeobaculum aegyptiacum]ARS90539.1 dehydrogenase [Natrarchaeobaculum aegyptiacum]